MNKSNAETLSTGLPIQILLCGDMYFGRIKIMNCIIVNNISIVYTSTIDSRLFDLTDRPWAVQGSILIGQVTSMRNSFRSLRV